MKLDSSVETALLIQQIETGKYIPLENMQKGVYFCKARNFCYGYWDGKEFLYNRYKFGQTFVDSEEHWDTGAPYGTAKPLMCVGHIGDISELQLFEE